MFLVENALNNEVLQFSDDLLKRMPFLKNDTRQLWKKEKVGEDGLFTLRIPQTQNFLTISHQFCNSPSFENFCVEGIILSYLITYIFAHFISLKRPKTKSPINQKNQ